MRATAFALGALIAASAFAADAQTWLGYGGPSGTRVYADARPPLEFDVASGKNVRWTAGLPNWGHGSPTVVGGRVFLMVEPGPASDWPVLLCLDGDTGRTLWEKPLDHLDKLIADEATRAKVRQDWHAVRQFTMLKYSFRAEMASGDPEKVAKKYRALGLDPDTSGDGLAPLDAAAHTKRKKELEKFGLPFEVWHDRLTRGIDCVGQAYCTPVTDGRRLYLTTAFGAFWCFDLDGKLLWLTCDPFVGKAYIYGYDYCKNARSSILAGQYLIATINNRVRAIDKDTGRIVWTSNAPHEKDAHTIVTPAVLKTGGKEVLLTAGPCAFLLPEGKPLKIDGWDDEGMQYLVKHDEPDVVYFCGSGEHSGWTGKGNADIQPPAAVRFSLEGDVLKAKVLWHGGDLGGPKTPGNPSKELWGGNAPWMLYHAGKFYHRSGVILDALTGKTLAGAADRRGAGRAVPETRHLLCVAGNHVFGLTRGSGRNDPGGAIMEVFTLDGKKVAANRLPPPTLTPQQQDAAVKCGWMGGNDKGEWAKGYTFTFGGDRIYIRSMMHLYCISAAAGSERRPTTPADATPRP